jgi:hypothetical protein
MSATSARLDAREEDADQPGDEHAVEQQRERARRVRDDAQRLVVVERPDVADGVADERRLEDIHVLDSDTGDVAERRRTTDLSQHEGEYLRPRPVR